MTPNTNTNTKMSVDEIIVNNGDATACKYKVTMRRSSTTTSSPVLSLVCLTLDINESDYSYPVDVSNLPKSVDNELNKLYQYLKEPLFYIRKNRSILLDRFYVIFWLFF